MGYGIVGTPPEGGRVGAVGTLLKHWRGTRRMSQAQLAADAEISTRHLSFLETGRSQPSRQMLLILGSALDMPLRERNALLGAGGFTPAYTQIGLSDPEMAQVKRALDFILERHEPFPAVVLDHAWNLLGANGGAAQFMGWSGPSNSTGNLMEALFDPTQLRPHVVNFDVLAPMMLARIRREADQSDASARLLDRLLAFPGVADQVSLRTPDLVVPVIYEKDGQRVSLFSTLTTLGTPTDITLQEIRIETFFPADEASEAFLRQAAANR